MQTDQRIPMQRLDAYVVAKEIAKRVHESKIRDTELRDQATRAAKSSFSLRLRQDGHFLDELLRWAVEPTFGEAGRQPR